MGLGFESAVAESLTFGAGRKHAVDDVQLFQQDGIGFLGAVGGGALALGVGVGFQGLLELVGDADVIHHQPAGLVLEHAVYAGNGLHQVVALHGLVHIHGVTAGRIEAGQPHIPHDHQPERVVDVLEALLEPFLGLLVVDVRLQQGPVRGGAGHHNLDGAFLRIVVVPFRAQGDNLVIQVNRNLPAHGHNHGLAVYGAGAGFKVVHQVFRHLLQARAGADQLLQPAPLALGFLAAANVFVVFNHFLHLIGQLLDLFAVDVQLGQAGFVEDGHGRAVVHRILDVVDGHVIAEHGPGVFVFALDGGAGKADERGIGQGIAHVAGVAELVGAVFLEGGFQAVLAAVGFVRDHHDVVAVVQNRVAGFVVQQGEFLNRGEDDTAGFPL